VSERVAILESDFDGEANFFSWDTHEIDNFLDHIDCIDREVRWSERFEAHAVERPQQNPQRSGSFVFEFGDIRSLLANWGYVQSAMSISDPTRLMLEYTQAMMGFLLFNSSPKTIEIIGLGGGSLAKYCHRYLPGATIRAVEIDEDVLSVSDQFCIPTDSDRLEILWADGYDFVTQDMGSTDVLLVDDFNSDNEPNQLSSTSFFRACRARLNPGGVLVSNLCNPQGRNQPTLHRLRESFNDLVTVPVEAGMNLVVFAFADEDAPFNLEKLRLIACELQRVHPLRLSVLVRGMVPDAR